VSTAVSGSHIRIHTQRETTISTPPSMNRTIVDVHLPNSYEMKPPTMSLTNSDVKGNHEYAHDIPSEHDSQQV
jgi:hypothetical protein